MLRYKFTDCECGSAFTAHSLTIAISNLPTVASASGVSPLKTLEPTYPYFGSFTTFIPFQNTQLCDGNADCDDADDECQDCTQGVFSSDGAMISTQALIPFLWIISKNLTLFFMNHIIFSYILLLFILIISIDFSSGILATFGNLVVIIHMMRKLTNRSRRGADNTQNVLVLNLAFADVLVGVSFVNSFLN